jgi:uncharacterized protein (UPF0276 family)
MGGRSPLVGLNLFPHASYQAAAGPLFAAGLVDAIEFDVDETFGWRDQTELPRWTTALLDLYADDNALYGHGVWFSFLSARWETRQEQWLQEVASECRRRRYRHLSEHFGFSTAGGLIRGTSLPVPFSPGAVRVGQDRLRRLAAASGLPVGLECQATALGRADALEQGAFLEALLAPGDGFLVLDVHNVWTQAYNLGLDATALIDSYPLERVRQLHISGGSWFELPTQPATGRFRLDTHDAPVPPEAFALLEHILPRLPNLEVVILENRGAGLDSAEDLARYQADFRRTRAIVEACHG